MLSVCFSYHTLLCFSSYSRWNQKQKRRTFQREMAKLEKCVGPAVQVTLQHAPTADRSSSTLWKKKFPHGSLQWGGNLEERVTTAAAGAWGMSSSMKMPGACILQVGDKGDSEVSHHRRDISDGKDLAGHLSIPLPRQDYTFQYLLKKIAQNNFTWAEEWSKGHNGSLPSLTSASQEVQPAAAVRWLWAQILQV